MDSLPVIPGLILVVVLLALNAMFVAAEFAYVTVRRTQMQQLANEGNTQAKRTLKALGNLDFYVAASQLGITMATIGLGFLGEPVIAGLIEPPIEDIVGSFAPAVSHTVAIGIAFTFVTVLHIVLGEFVPKTLALEAPGKTTMWLSYPMQIFVRIFGPAIWLLNTTGNVLLGLLGMKVRPMGDEPLKAEDLALTFESSASAGLISRRELDLSRNTLRLASLQVGDLMVPRNEVIGIPVDASREDIVRIFAGHRYTRFPVYTSSLDDIIGVLNAKQAVFNLGSPDADWHRDIQQPLILPETVTIEHALEAAREANHALMILADEFGGIAGVLSLFDVVEFLAGHLPDEFESGQALLSANPDGSLLAPGLMHLVDLADELGITVPDVDAHTLGGLVMELLERIPVEGDEVFVDGHRIRVSEMNNRRVGQVLLIPEASVEREAAK